MIQELGGGRGREINASNCEDHEVDCEDFDYLLPVVASITSTEEASTKSPEGESTACPE